MTYLGVFIMKILNLRSYYIKENAYLKKYQHIRTHKIIINN